ncbi:GyrI-like domain-containing protein [Deefgea tanakiae]|uniref:GyrI-like domain-containing protein n=1 Tax=Deefgea tanakiae TaxID=2865840 RepID=A0ABX8Z8R4_9NEIS|nr:GyrI-like domain-containing protein [Deefgea tanakiae]QZA77714.1 GyrI-like domain-containing protein [Deefgea tanakiae]
MSKASTMQDYTRRLMRVVQTLWQDPLRVYTTEQLAEVAHFSPFHFHRIYREMMGETVKATQQRLRLHFASRDLVEAGELPLSRVAQRAGYQSSAAFVRSFAAAYGVTPGVYRRQRLQLSLQFKLTPEIDMYSVEIRSISAPIHLAARRHLGPYLNIGEAFSLLELALPTLPALPDARWFGLYHDDPYDVRQGVVGAELRSDACVEITEQGALPADLQKVQITAGRYAVIEHRGAYSELEQAYKWLIGVWLPQSGEMPLPVPGIELYLNDPCNTEPKDLRTEVWLALAD